MDIFTIPITIFSTFYNFVATSWDWLSQPVPFLQNIVDAMDLVPDWISIIIGTHNMEVILRQLAGLAVIECIFGSSLIIVIVYSIVKFFLPTS